MRTAIVFTLALCLSELAAAETFVVNPDGTGDFIYIRYAIAASSDGDTVALADGVYRDYRNSNLDYEGRAITVRSISGDPSACIIDCDGSEYYQRRAFYFQSGEGRGSVLEGVTIKNGYMIGQVMPPHGDNQGAAIRCESVSPTIRNCRFLNNNTQSYFAGGRGGAIFCAEESTPLIEDCVFEGNSSGHGGAVSFLRCTPVVRRCSFTNNSGSRGGAMECFDSNAILEDIEFIGNQGYEGGGLGTFRSSVSAVRCLFSGNLGTESGGAVWMEKASAPEFVECRFESNSSLAEGGAVTATGMSETVYLTLSDCELSGNAAATMGGAFYLQNTVAQMSHVLITGNEAATGGAVFVEGASALSFSNMTVADNRVMGGTNTDAAIDVGGYTQADLATTIIAFNQLGGAVSCGPDASILATCSDLFGNEYGDWTGCVSGQLGTGGNVSEDPLFCRENQPDLPFALQDDSPCSPEHSHGCGLIGALDPACGSTSVSVTSWGAIKALFR